MDRPPDSSLVIGVATSTAERMHLARLLADADAVLLVSSAEQARAFLALTTAPETTPVVLSPAAEPHPTPVATSDPDELSLDVHRRVVRWRDREISLTRLEHDFLRCLVTEPGRVWTYQRLHLAVWGNEHLGHGSHIHSVVKRLRQKLADLGTTVTIHAVRGVGFHLLPA
ncbi:transcriptional regulator [Kribbella voronezhensis]|uniref:Transcriptional regulator n=1 Tax=Kribbella voronezhensis TaxID=2512212 RepID=A0A4V3FIG3_9ACTN|nr:winged helix-turn-helix domain-containing protein [Kribbella voronezhensis]TDU82333.1 transcriptional regulator [Kribbella voronezhensis]